MHRMLYDGLYYMATTCWRILELFENFAKQTFIKANIEAFIESLKMYKYQNVLIQMSSTSKCQKDSIPFNSF